MFNDPNENEDNQADNKSDLKDLRKKRDEYAVDIRKKKREELLHKKRNKNLEIDQKFEDGTIIASHNLAGDEELRKSIAEWLKRSYDMKDFGALIEAANSEDRYKQHYGVIGLRKILSNEHGPPIQHVIDANMVSRLIIFMQNTNEPHLQLEAAWALTNIASGTSQQTQSIIDKNGIPSFIALLASSRIEVAEQAIWAIGNIAGDSAYFRDLILKFGGIDPLLSIINTSDNKAIIKHGTWALSNLCRGKPLPDLALVDKAMPTFSAVMQKEGDTDVLTDAAWALSYLTRTVERAALLVETGIIPTLVQHLDDGYLPLLIPCLRTIGNIVTGTEELTNQVLKVPDFLPKIFNLVNHKRKAVQREACWALSNITAGNAVQIECIMGVPEYVQCLIKTTASETPEIQREATWVLSNSTKNSQPVQIARLATNGVIDCFISLLGSKDAKSIEVVLEGINNILNWGAIVANKEGSTENQLLVLLEEKGAIKLIENLQEHPNNEVYERALKILETHFESDSII